MEPRHVREIRDEKAATPEAANARVKALRQLLALANEAGIATTNSAREVPYLASASDGFHTWAIEEVQIFEAAHPIGTKAPHVASPSRIAGCPRCVTYWQHHLSGNRIQQALYRKRLRQSVPQMVRRCGPSAVLSARTSESRSDHSSQEWCDRAPTHGDLRLGEP